MCKNFFEMCTKFGFIRLKSCGVFAHLLVFEVKGELTMPKLVQASSGSAHSWYTFHDIYGVGLQQKLWSMAQDKQSLHKVCLIKVAT